MNLEAVRAFVLIAEYGRFQDAAAELRVTQQAVSKRIAALERYLGVPLFTRGGHGAELTLDGRAFLPHAKAVLLAVRGAVESVRPGRRALRVDVLERRLASAAIVLDFHRRHPEVEIDLVGLGGAQAAFGALLDGTIDAAFCCVRDPRSLPAAISHRRAYDEPLELLVGHRNPLATAPEIRLADLTAHRVWVPGIVVGTEWGDYYEAMAEDFGLRIDATGPDFGMEHLLDTITDSATLTTFIGPRMRIAWSARPELRRIPIRRPAPIYPWSLAWHSVNRHPALGTLRDHLRDAAAPTPGPEEGWLPEWARI
ncbi:LysR family transcriptional regulator [Actinoallomurus soli]|uniref:LysR family transcriptional regulator n=1 Tax=Actinoallomurus soli TaxID=2952535 RepID=UPI0020921411|nr:LysR family transcriptional regulator [Actinoallomurus soli]MCO5970918.1 LysR family transcriptional regulator [Actinoallomurus soli]